MNHDEYKKKKLFIQRSLLIFRKKGNLLGKEEKISYTHYAGGGTKVIKSKIKKTCSDGPVKTNHKVVHVKISKKNNGEKDYQVSFSNHKQPP